MDALNFEFGIRPLRPAAVSFLSGLVLCGHALGEQQSFPPKKDNPIYQSATGSLSNGKGQHFFAGTTGKGLTTRALFAFDLTVIPPGGIVNLREDPPEWRDASSTQLSAPPLPA